VSGGRGIAVVTGASRGIGQAVAIRLARDGFRIAILDVLPPDETAALLPEAPWYAQTDLAQPRAIEAAFARLDDEWGTPAVLVNVAGVFAGMVPFLQVTEEQWDHEMNVNARGLYFASQAAARRMAPAGRGRIVNVLSTAAAQGFALASPYCASKGAALLVTRALAVELAAHGILVNGVGPGTVAALTSEAYLEAAGAAAHERSRTPLGRVGTPEDIAAAVAFFATDASWTTGQALYVDGGFLAAGLPYLDDLRGGDAGRLTP
jgi:NAD(P)-dependent dehydrogenase (short-subunit alcohol dehydrogenase family)